MKIGVFDSGLGGLIITKSLLKDLPEYDFLYFGDTKHLPYGEKSKEEITDYTVASIKYLINNNCKIIIIACNTASAVVLRYLQQVYMPENYPEIKVLGVVVPTVEEAIASSKTAIGVIATPSTVSSKMYTTEIKKINPEINIQEVPAPALVKAVENNDFAAADKAVKEYLKEFSSIDSLILGCTHYPILKENFKKHLPSWVHLISQDDFMGQKLKSYLQRHREIESLLDKNGDHRFVVSQLNNHYKKVAGQILPGIEIEEFST